MLMNRRGAEAQSRERKELGCGLVQIGAMGHQTCAFAFGYGVTSQTRTNFQLG